MFSEQGVWMFQAADFNDLPEFCAAHAQDEQAATGCTIFIAPEGAVCGTDVRGGGPATRETDLLDPTKMIQQVHAVMLSGGSAFGLEASCGAMDVLADAGIGFGVGSAVVPIIPEACLFDLLIGENIHPDKAMGAKACKAALDLKNASNSEDRNLKQGNFGAGTGCTVGKMGFPDRAMKSGFGWSGIKLGKTVILACVAVNALGNVMAEDGNWLAGTLDSQGRVCDPLQAAAEFIAAKQMSESAASKTVAAAEDAAHLTQNTTLGVILTNATLSKAECTRISQMTQDAYARTIKPVHTQNDGDAIFTMASCNAPQQDMQVDMLGIMATQAMEQAIRNGVSHAASAYGLKAANSL